MDRAELSADRGAVAFESIEIVHHGLSLLAARRDLAGDCRGIGGLALPARPVHLTADTATPLGPRGWRCSASPCPACWIARRRARYERLQQGTVKHELTEQLHQRDGIGRGWRQLVRVAALSRTCRRERRGPASTRLRRASGSEQHSDLEGRSGPWCSVPRCPEPTRSDRAADVTRAVTRSVAAARSQRSAATGSFGNAPAFAALCSHATA